MIDEIEQQTENTAPIAPTTSEAPTGAALTHDRTGAAARQIRAATGLRVLVVHPSVAVRYRTHTQGAVALVLHALRMHLGAHPRADHIHSQVARFRSVKDPQVCEPHADAHPQRRNEMTQDMTQHGHKDRVGTRAGNIGPGK